MTKSQFHEEANVRVGAPLADAFAYLDDHARLTGHMGERSWRMGGGRMSVTLDRLGGHAVGSRLRLAGRVLGIELHVDEDIVVYEQLRRKVWETVGTPRLLVIGPYRMGFETRPLDGVTEIRVFIDYERPRGIVGRILSALAGGWYARWCTRSMADDASRHFGVRREAHHGPPLLSGTSRRRVQGNP